MSLKLRYTQGKLPSAVIAAAKLSNIEVRAFPYSEKEGAGPAKLTFPDGYISFP